MVGKDVSVSTRNLNVYYNDFHAIKHVSMDIKARDITALIGPSGSGKSSVLRAINRMNELIPGARTTGEVIIDRRNIYEPDVDVVELRKRVGMVFQRANPFPMTVFDNVAYGPRIHGTALGKQLEEWVERSLRAAALWDEVKDKLRRSAFALSGGQQQRLCIARLLAVEPEILLMDEPASALDPISTLRIEDLMRELAKQYTIIIVTHNMQQAARVATHTGFFLSGELIEFDRSDKIFTKPEDKRTEDYITGRFG